MGTQLIKCGITQQVITNQDVHLMLISPSLQVQNVWNNSTGQSYKVPFTINKNLGSYFQPKSFPIKGSFDDYLNFTVNESQENVIPCFLFLRSLFGSDGYQNSSFKIQEFLNNYPSILAIFLNGCFTLEDLKYFQDWDELSSLMQQITHEIMFKDVPCYDIYDSLVTQSHLFVISDNAYQKILQESLNGCIQANSQQDFNFYSEYVTMDYYFQQVNEYLRQFSDINSKIYFTNFFNVLSKMSFCSINFHPITSVGQDYENLKGQFLNNISS